MNSRDEFRRDGYPRMGIFAPTCETIFDLTWGVWHNAAVTTPTPTYPYFSHSRIQAFRKCPQAFEYSYVQELPEEFSTIEKHLGTAVHELFEWAYGERAANRPLADSAVRDRYDAVWAGLDIATARIVKKGMTATNYYQQGLDMVLSHCQGHIRPDQSTTLQLEHEFELTLADGINYRGVIDRIARQASGMLRLTDYKTGRLAPDPLTDLQLRSYTLYAFSAYADDAVEICYFDLRNNRPLLHTVLRSQAESIHLEIRQAIESIIAATAFPASPSTLCSWCGHLPRCNAGQAKLNRKSGAALGGICPDCGAKLRQRNGRNGPFLGCSDYPACHFSCNI